MSQIVFAIPQLRLGGCPDLGSQQSVHYLRNCELNRIYRAHVWLNHSISYLVSVVWCWYCSKITKIDLLIPAFISPTMASSDVHWKLVENPLKHQHMAIPVALDFSSTISCLRFVTEYVSGCLCNYMASIWKVVFTNQAFSFLFPLIIQNSKYQALTFFH